LPIFEFRLKAAVALLSNRQSTIGNRQSAFEMKVLHVITRLIVGGAQQNTIASCAAQVAAGHQVWLAYGPIYGPEGSLLDEAEKSGAVRVEIKSMRRAILPVHDWLCYRALRRLIRDVKPDLVHTHSSKAGILGRAAAWAERGGGRPVVIHTIHGLPFHERQPRVVHGLYVASERWAARRCDRLIGVTRAMVEAFQANNIGTAEPFTVIPSGIDLSKFVPPPPESRAAVRRELGISADAPVVGILARLDPLKGQDDLLDILPRLRERYPAVKLLVVGGGWHHAALEARVKREGLGDAVVFTGIVPPSRVPEMLGAMDVNTLPSYQEGQPRTLVQALLCGVPIVGYDAGGIGEVCIDGQTGRLVPVGNRDALADAILWMLDHPAERRALTERGQAYARERFDLRSMIRRLEEVYTEAIMKPS
jgi:glycosyltransferase involved in cell wall biosynthesis